MTRNFTILGSVAFTFTAFALGACGGGELESETSATTPAGAAGTTNGNAGSAGKAGASAGNAGSAGAVAGASGSAGKSGAAGSAGSSGSGGKGGSAGASGSAGKGGGAGASGSAGKGGSAGASGSAGKAGSAGASGSAGKAGAAGSAGKAGAAGASGTAGAGGGTAGTAGASGTAGTGNGGAGAAGSAGNAGSGGAAASCTDTIKNQDETDVDCGGALCGTCADGQGCLTGTDCKSTSCDAATAKCVPAVSCTNQVKDGAETDVDCGGGTCPACPTNDDCKVPSDCVSGVCDAGTGKCLDPTCTDLVRNGLETDTDCGGGTCKTCDVGGGCKVDADCSSALCDPATLLCLAVPTCTDLMKNGNETDIDCGGGSCNPCTTGQGCLVGADCDSTLCDVATAKCLPSPTCFDVVKNQDETGVDCGGSTCAKRCTTGEGCLVAGDCDSGVCDAGTGTCTAPACPDTVQNGTETDVDCGGPGCAKCVVGQKCLVATDCQTNVCDPGTNTCAPAACGDGIVSPGEGCDLGPANATVPGLVYKQGATTFSTTPFTGAATGAGFYSYGMPNGSSGNTGNESTDTCFMYFYRQTTTGVLSLIMHCGRKSMQGAAQADLDCTGMATASVVTVSDDNTELRKTNATTLRGRWNFNNNTDGGVVSGVEFPATNGTMTCTWSGLTGLPNGVFWLNSDGTRTAITQGASFDITVNTVGSACRTNCTAPACNDGILDAGEMCDDGNALGGSCPATCLFP